MIRNAFIVFLLFIWIMSGCQNESLKKNHYPPLFLTWGFSVEGFPITRGQLKKLEQETQITAQIIQFYLQWSTSSEFDSLSSSLDEIAHIGAIPCLTFEPMLILDNVEKTISYELILNGQYDKYLIHIANEIKKWKKPLIIRFAQEMNLKRYHWGTTEEDFNSQSPSIYVKMFRYIVTLFRDQQIENVLWAFCPNVDSDPNLSWNKVENYYPGDDYVDILGMDGYNWAITDEIAKANKITWTKPWLSFELLFSPLYQELKAISPNKPIIVFETGCVNQNDGKKTIWIKNALQTAKDWGLIGIIWFQSNKERDWRIQQGGDYSYIPMIRKATNPLNEWLLNNLKNSHSSRIEEPPN